MFGPFWTQVAEDERLAPLPDDATFTEKTVAERTAGAAAAIDRPSAETELQQPTPPSSAGGPISAVQSLPSVGVVAGEGDGDLELGDVLGEGGMGIVRRARQRSLERDVAVKTLRHPDRAQVSALLAEARVTGALEHPNVIPVHALGRDAEGRAVLVMKRVEGETWSKLLAHPDHPTWTAAGRWSKDPLTRNLEVLLQVCDGVRFAHSRGWLHRDLKPENVMVGAFGEVYVMDWGLAVRIGATDVPPGGTPAYMAPEMLDARATERTDVYLLGAILHRILTGKPRHTGTSRLSVLMSVSRSDPPELGPAVPGELAQACRKATHQDALQRHEDVASFRRAIADCLEHRGSIAVAQVARERLAELERASATTPPDAARVARVGAECRFGFLHALETWPANDDARRGLRACLGVLAAFEAEHGSPDAAQALCDELRALDPEAPDLAALAARVAERRAESESARRLAAELDPRVSREDRRRFLLLLIGLIAPALLALGLTTAAGLFDPTYAYIIGLPVIGFTLLVVLLFAGRRTLFRNDFNRRVSLSLVVFLASIILHRIVSARLGIPVPQILTNDLCLAALTAALSGLGLGIRRLFPVAAILAAGALVATREPTTPTPILIAVCGVAGVVLVEGLVRRPPAPRER